MSRKKSKSPTQGAKAARPSPERDRSATPWRSPWVEIALVGLVLVVYLQVRTFEFVNWDDATYVTQNPTVLAGLTWRGVVWAFTNTDSVYWLPVTWISHMLDVSLFGPDPGAHHLVNLALHAVNSVLLFWGLRRLTSAPGRSAAVAMIFAVHPLHAESVAWIAERKDVLSSCLLLLALWTYAGYVRRATAIRYLAVAASFALALMAKPMVVTFPVVLILLDVWPLDRLTAASWRRIALEKVPLFALALIDGVMTLAFQSHVGAMPTLTSLPFSARVSRALVSYVIYARQAFWPIHLAAFYPQGPIGFQAELASTLALLAISWGSIRFRKSAPFLFVGWWWYVVMLAPVIGIFQAGEQAHADRFMYLALVGLLLTLVWTAATLADRFHAGSAVLPVAASSAIALLVPLGVHQTATWHDSLTLWQHAADVTTSNYKAYEKLGQANRELGHFDEARRDYLQALGAAPPDSPRYAAAIHNDLGLVLVRQGRAAEAATEFGLAEGSDPSLAAAHLNRADTLATIGRTADALAEFREAARLDPSSAEVRVGLGNMLLEEDHTDEAIASFREAIGLMPGSADAHNGLGAAFLAKGNATTAITEFTEALRLRPSFPDAEVNLAMALIKMGRSVEARQHLEHALQIAPNVRGARELLASLDRR